MNTMRDNLDLAPNGFVGFSHNNREKWMMLLNAALDQPNPSLDLVDALRGLERKIKCPAKELKPHLNFGLRVGN
jgi:hypothetical protein